MKSMIRRLQLIQFALSFFYFHSRLMAPLQSSNRNNLFQVSTKAIRIVVCAKIRAQIWKYISEIRVIFFFHSIQYVLSSLSSLLANHFAAIHLLKFSVSLELCVCVHLIFYFNWNINKSHFKSFKFVEYICSYFLNLFAHNLDS